MEVHEDISDKKWLSLLKTQNDPLYFQTPMWARIISESFEQKNVTKLYHIDGMEILFPLIEEKYAFWRFLRSINMGYGGIISKDTISSECLKSIISDILGYNGLLVLTLPPKTDITNFTKCGLFSIETEYCHILDLRDGFDVIWRERFDRNTRVNVKKAIKKNVEIVVTDRYEDFITFNNLYKLRTKQWGYSNPPINKKFFETLCKYGSPHVKLRLAVKDSKPIGGMITLEYGKTVHALMNIVPTEFYRLYPSQLLFKDVIESSCEGGYFSLNFGGDLRRKGLIEYKEKLGGTSCETKKLYANSPFGKVLRSIQRMIKL